MEPPGTVAGGAAQWRRVSDGAFPSELEQRHGRNQGHEDSQQWTILLGAEVVRPDFWDEVSRERGWEMVQLMTTRGKGVRKRMEKVVEVALPVLVDFPF